MSKSENWETIYINDPTAPFGEYSNMIKLNGWQVVNAPRPIPGEVEWTGEFRHGCFYAAGDTGKFGKTWDDFDAWPVEEINNIQIADILSAKCKEDGCCLITRLGFYGDSIAKLASEYGYPWFESPD